MVDAHDRAAGDPAREHHHAVPRGQNGSPGGAPQVGSAVAGGERMGRGVEGAGDREVAVHRRAPEDPSVRRGRWGGGRLRGGRYGREEDGRAEDQEGQEGGAHGGTLAEDGGGWRCPGRSVDDGTAGDGPPSGSRMLSGAARSDGSTSRVLIPLPRGGPPPRSRQAIGGCVAPRAAGGAPPRAPAPQRRGGAGGRAKTRGAERAVVRMKQLLDGGVPWGHKPRRWNPKMKR